MKAHKINKIRHRFFKLGATLIMTLLLAEVFSSTALAGEGERVWEVNSNQQLIHLPLQNKLNALPPGEHPLDGPWAGSVITEGFPWQLQPVAFTVEKDGSQLTPGARIEAYYEITSDSVKCYGTVDWTLNIPISFESDGTFSFSGGSTNKLTLAGHFVSPDMVEGTFHLEVLTGCGTFIQDGVWSARWGSSPPLGAPLPLSASPAELDQVESPAPLKVMPGFYHEEINNPSMPAGNATEPGGGPFDLTPYRCPTLTSARSDFSLIALPDTQYYSAEINGGSAADFEAQTQWIIQNESALNIAYVAHLGDITENGDKDTDTNEWFNAHVAMSILEKTADPSDDIPYGVTPGNHDVLDGTTQFEFWFGVTRFSGRSYYGGHYGTDNRYSYGSFSSSGMDFIVINLYAYEIPTAAVLDWADALLKANPNRRAIVTGHYLMGEDNSLSFSDAGQAIYDALKDNPNLFLMLSGHRGVGQRTDVFHGNAVHTLMADYQRENGGNGWLRVLTFSPARNQIQVTTYSPTLDSYKIDPGNQFSLFYDMSPVDPNLIGTDQRPHLRQSCLE